MLTCGRRGFAPIRRPGQAGAAPVLLSLGQLGTPSVLGSRPSHRQCFGKSAPSKRNSSPNWCSHRVELTGSSNRKAQGADFRCGLVQAWGAQAFP